MKVWILTNGSYSDYSIVGVYSSENLARAVMAERKKTGDGCEGNDPEEWDVDCDAHIRATPYWEVSIRPSDGRLTDGDHGHWFKSDRSCVVIDGTWWPPPDGPVIIARSPVSLDHARKVAVEKRQEWLRKHGGPKP